MAYPLLSFSCTSPQPTSPDTSPGSAQSPVTPAPRRGPQPAHPVAEALPLELFQELLLPLDLPGVSLGAVISHKDIVPWLGGLSLEEGGVGTGDQGGPGAGHGAVGGTKPRRDSSRDSPQWY